MPDTKKADVIGFSFIDISRSFDLYVLFLFLVLLIKEFASEGAKFCIQHTEI